VLTLAYLVVWAGDVSRHVSWMVGARTHGGLADAGQSTGTASTGRRRRVSLVDHEIDRHFTLQTADVSMTEVIAEFVHLHRQHQQPLHHIYPNHTVVKSNSSTTTGWCASFPGHSKVGQKNSDYF